MIVVHKAAAVYRTVDAVDSSVGRELPHDKFNIICQLRYFIPVTCYHVFIFSVFTGQILVVEVVGCINYGF